MALHFPFLLASLVVGSGGSDKIRSHYTIDLRESRNDIHAIEEVCFSFFLFLLLCFANCHEIDNVTRGEAQGGSQSIRHGNF
jgi:hypothetical protein